jgi:ketosteroid isomerase-like protein
MHIVKAIAASLGITLLAAGCATATPQASAAARTSPQQAVTAFLEAFNSLDPVRFDASFAEDASMFFPAGPFPKARVEGKQAVTAAFHNFFDMAKQRGATRLGIQPLDLRVQEYGDFAVATFHLRGNGNVGRRSILMRRDRAGWRIVHFHASALEE